MNLTQLLKMVSNRLDDTKVPYRWSDEELTSHANQRLNEICEVVPVLKDGSTAQVILIDIKKTVDSYLLDPRIVFIHQVKLDLEVVPLLRTSFNLIKEYWPNWKIVTGTPRNFMTDVESGRLFIYPIPIVDDTLRMNVTRFPLATLDYTRADASTPEIPALFHELLIPGITALAYRKGDAETEDLVRSAADEKEWLGNLERIKKFYIKFNDLPATAVPHQAYL